MATQSFYEDLVLDSPEAVCNLEKAINEADRRGPLRIRDTGAMPCTDDVIRKFMESWNIVHNPSTVRSIGIQSWRFDPDPHIQIWLWKASRIGRHLHDRTIMMERKRKFGTYLVIDRDTNDIFGFSYSEWNACAWQYADAQYYVWTHEHRWWDWCCSIILSRSDNPFRWCCQQSWKQGFQVHQQKQSGRSEPDNHNGMIVTHHTLQSIHQYPQRFWMQQRYVRSKACSSGIPVKVKI